MSGRRVYERTYVCHCGWHIELWRDKVGDSPQVRCDQCKKVSTFRMLDRLPSRGSTRRAE